MDNKVNGKRFSFLLIGVFEVLLLGILSLGLQYSFGVIPLELFKFPINLYLFLELIIGITAIHFVFRNQPWLKMLSSPSFAILSILFFSIWILVMAMVPQTPKYILPFGLNQIVHTWMFSIASALLIVSLGFVTLRRSFPFKRKNIPFFINHFGLWIVLVAGLLGAADRKELLMQVYEGQVIWYGQDENQKIVELPLALKLEQFVMKSYPPKIALVNKMGKPYKTNGDQLAEITKPTQLTIVSKQIRVLNYFPEAITKGDSMESSVGALATSPAAYVNVSGFGKTEFKGWISSGNYAQPPKVLELTKDTLLCLLTPEPAYFGSKVTIYTQSDNQSVSKIISVNNPTSIEGWTIYQYGYDVNLGNDSPYSVFKLVYDPWFPVVYFGIILLMIGALWMILSKLKTTNSKEDSL